MSVDGSNLQDKGNFTINEFDNEIKTYNENLTASIDSISNLGDVSVKFSMSVDLPLDYMNFDDTIITLSIVAGEDSDPD